MLLHMPSVDSWVRSALTRALSGMQTKDHHRRHTPRTNALVEPRWAAGASLAGLHEHNGSGACSMCQQRAVLKGWWVLAELGSSQQVRSHAPDQESGVSRLRGECTLMPQWPLVVQAELPTLPRRRPVGTAHADKLPAPASTQVRASHGQWGGRKRKRFYLRKLASQVAQGAVGNKGRPSRKRVAILPARVTLWLAALLLTRPVRWEGRRRAAASCSQSQPPYGRQPHQQQQEGDGVH